MSEERPERLNVLGLVVVVLLIAIAGGALSYRAAVRENERLTAANAKLAAAVSRARVQEKRLRGSIGLGDHFVLPGGWETTGHARAARESKNGAFACYECHTAGEPFCTSCHVRLAE